MTYNTLLSFFIDAKSSPHTCIMTDYGSLSRQCCASEECNVSVQSCLRSTVLHHSMSCLQRLCSLSCCDEHFRLKEVHSAAPGICIRLPAMCSCNLLVPASPRDASAFATFGSRWLSGVALNSHAGTSQGP
jgi:hypothetical protein